VMKKVSNGWPGIMAGLKTLLETGHPLGITQDVRDETGSRLRQPASRPRRRR